MLTVPFLAPQSFYNFVEVNNKFRTGSTFFKFESDPPKIIATKNILFRFFPPVSRNDRLCNKDFEYKGIKIPKVSCFVQINQHCIAEEQDKPNKFNCCIFNERVQALVYAFKLYTLTLSTGLNPTCLNQNGFSKRMLVTQFLVHGCPLGLVPGKMFFSYFWVFIFQNKKINMIFFNLI